MAKDAYWFRHDSNSGRGLKMLQLAHIYTHWGKGVYWDVVEVLREQDGYKYEHSEHAIDLLSTLVNVSDKIRFSNWFKDCCMLGLFEKDDKYFFSPVLIKNMAVWETKKSNGNQGGRPKKNRIKTELKPKRKPNQNHNRIEDNRIDIKWEDFISGFNQVTKKNFKGNDKVKGQLSARSKDGYTLEQILKATSNCFSDPYHREHPQYLTPEFILRADKLDKYINYSRPFISPPEIAE